MPNTLAITVENPDELRNAGMYDTGALIRIQSSATEAGAFADIAGTGSTPTIAVAAATRSYTGYDPAGTSSTWYRLRYENAGATRLSDWLAAFQVGGEEAGQICSIYDVEQRLTGSVSANNRELLLDFIRDATTDIESYTSRWFVPRPSSGTTTILLTPTTSGRALRFPQGIRSITAIAYATSDQPDTGGSYTTITATDAVIRPASYARSPLFPAGTEIVLLESSSGRFYPALNSVQVTGAFGCAYPPATIAGIGATTVVKRFTAKGSGVALAAGAGDFETRLLRWLSPEERETLDRVAYIGA